MQTVILAGGLGTRIRSVAPDTPKSLIRVAGKPFIEHQFALLARYNIRDVLLCIGHMADLIVAHVGDGSAWSMNVAYSLEDPSRLLGTGGALVNALPHLQEEFLVLYGDSYLPTDYGAVVRAFQARNVPAMMCVFRNEGRWDHSNIRVEKDRVVFYSKSAKPGEADYIDYGLTAYRRSVIEECAVSPRPLDLQKILGDQLAKGCLGAFEVRERFYEIGKPEGLAELDEVLRHG